MGQAPLRAGAVHSARGTTKSAKVDFQIGRGDSGSSRSAQTPARAERSDVRARMYSATTGTKYSSRCAPKNSALRDKITTRHSEASAVEASAMVALWMR